MISFKITVNERRYLGQVNPQTQKHTHIQARSLPKTHENCQENVFKYSPTRISNYIFIHQP